MRRSEDAVYFSKNVYFCYESRIGNPNDKGLIMRRIVVYLIVLFSVVSLSAEPVDSVMARRVADAFRYRVGMDAGDATMQRWGTEMYIFNYASGYVVVAADDVAMPVLGFATEGRIDVEDMPRNMRYWIALNAQAIGEARERRVIVSDAYRRLWRDIVSDAKTAKSGDDTIVGPFLSSHWGQDAYYNAQCPIDRTVNARSVTGCVATAVGQIMRYWGYPATGTGTHTYTSSKCGVLSANFDTTRYDWSNMPDRLTSSCTAAQVRAVSTLLYHIGVASDMNYGASESGTFTGLAITALRNYFGYSPSITLASRSGYSDAQWCALVRRELDMERPLLYSGSDASRGGHAFVCDGYRTVGNYFYFGFKWGWDGQCDGYWTLAPVPTGSSMSFTLYQEIGYRIEPATMLHTDKSKILFHGAGESQSLTISSSVDDDESWTIMTSVPWLAVSHTSGEGNGVAMTITLTASPNVSGHFRSDTLMLRQGRRMLQVVVQQMVNMVARTINRYDTVDVGETGYHTYMDTLFYEDFNSDNFDCWILDAGANCLGYSPVTQMCWQRSTSFCKDAFEGLSLYEATEGTDGRASFAKSPYFPVAAPSRTTASMMLYDEGVIDDETYYYDEAALIYSAANGNGYLMSVTNTDVEKWTYKSVGMQNVAAGDVRVMLGHANSGGVGMGVDNLLVYGPRRVNIPHELSVAHRGANLTTSDTVYRVGCVPTVIRTQWTVRGSADTVTTRDTVTIVRYVTDTLMLHDTVHSVDTIIIHDTVYVHDTVCPTLNDVSVSVVLDAKVYSVGRQIVVEGADAAVAIYDVHGRCLIRRRNEHGIMRFNVSAAGVYMVRIGDGAAHKIVVL